MSILYYTFLLIIFISLCMHAWRRIKPGVEIEKSAEFINANSTNDESSTTD